MTLPATRAALTSDDQVLVGPAAVSCIADAIHSGAGAAKATRTTASTVPPPAVATAEIASASAVLSDSARHGPAVVGRCCVRGVELAAPCTDRATVCFVRPGLPSVHRAVLRHPDDHRAQDPLAWTDAGVTMLSVGATVTALPPHRSTNTVVGLQTAAAETLAAGAPGAAAHGATAIRLTATRLDAARQPLAGVQVGFDTTLGTLSAGTATTDDQGQDTVRLTSSQSGSHAVTATVASLSGPQTVQVSFLAEGVRQVAAAVVGRNVAHRRGRC